MTETGWKGLNICYTYHAWVCVFEIILPYIQLLSTIHDIIATINIFIPRIGFDDISFKLSRPIAKLKIEKKTRISKKISFS